MLLALVLAIFSGILGALGELVNKKASHESGKKSPFECGFDAGVFARKPFSVHFFFTCVVFLVFDVELLVLLPWLSKTELGMGPTALGALSLVGVMAIFLGGLILEWGFKALEWQS